MTLQRYDNITYSKCITIQQYDNTMIGRYDFKTIRELNDLTQRYTIIFGLSKKAESLFKSLQLSLAIDYLEFR